MVRPIDAPALDAVQVQFHEVIRGRIAGLKDAHELRLPDLAPLTEYAAARFWFPVPGMYGGFAYWLGEDTTPVLVTESWCRVAGGSGQRHEITPHAARMVDAGFV